MEFGLVPRQRRTQPEEYRSNGSIFTTSSADLGTIIYIPFRVVRLFGEYSRPTESGPKIVSRLLLLIFPYKIYVKLQKIRARMSHVYYAFTHIYLYSRSDEFIKKPSPRTARGTYLTARAVFFVLILRRNFFFFKRRFTTVV